MALTLPRTLRHFPASRLRGALAALTGPPGRPGHTAVGRRPRPSSSPARRARRADLHSEPLSAQGHDVGGFGQNRKNVGGQVLCRRLSGSASPEEVLSLINALRTVPDAAEAARRRIRERGPPRETPHNHVLQALCARLEQEASSLSSTALLTALQALTLWDADPQSHLLLKLVAECQHRLQSGGLGAHGLCVLGESLIKLQGPGCATLGLVMHQLQGEKLENFRPEDIVALYRILQACTEKADQYQTFLNKINNFSLSIISNLSPELTSQVLTALVALDQTQALPLVIKLGKHVVRHIPRFTSEELRKVLEAFVYFGHNDRFLTTALEQHVASLRLTPDPEVISTVAEYCSRKHILSEPILNAVAETFVCQSEKFSPSQISESIEAFGKLNYLPPNASDLFRKLEDILFTRFNYFPPKTLLKLLHSCSLIEYHPVNFMAKLYSPYFLQRLLGEESHLDRLSLAQLTQLLLTSILECPFYKGPKLLPKYQVKSFLTPCCALETPVDFQLYKSVMSGLMDVLGGRQYFASKVLTPYCYTVDVEIKLDEEGFVLPFTVNEDVHKRVALCIDGPKRFCLNSKHLLGKEAIKQRHLRFLGYEVVQLPYYEIEMLKSRLELVEYLQRKLFSQNTGICW